MIPACGASAGRRKSRLAREAAGASMSETTPAGLAAHFAGEVAAG